jgi:hypothetical protein
MRTVFVRIIDNYIAVVGAGIRGDPERLVISGGWPKGKCPFMWLPRYAGNALRPFKRPRATRERERGLFEQASRLLEEASSTPTRRPQFCPDSDPIGGFERYRDFSTINFSNPTIGRVKLAATSREGGYRGETTQPTDFRRCIASGTYISRMGGSSVP